MALQSFLGKLEYPSCGQKGKEDEDRLGFWRSNNIIFSPDADEEETETEKRAAPLPSQDPRALWLGFPMDPTHQRWFLLLLHRFTVVLELSSQTHSQKPAQWQTHRKTPGHCFTAARECQESVCPNPFFINSSILLGKIIYKFACSDYSKWLARVWLCWSFMWMQDRAWFCFTKLSVQSWKGNQNSTGLSWKCLREAHMQNQTAKAAPSDFPNL